MRRLLLPLAALLVLPLLGSDAPKDYGGATEMNELQGVWRRTGLTINGQEADLGPEREVMFGRRSVVYRVGSMEIRGTYTAERSKTPAHLDETLAGGPNAGGPWLSLYRVEGDTLCIAYKEGARPRDFDAPFLFVETYRRE